MPTQLTEVLFYYFMAGLRFDQFQDSRVGTCRRSKKKTKRFTVRRKSFGSELRVEIAASPGRCR
jgi:hypothetical protein